MRIGFVTRPDDGARLFYRDQGPLDGPLTPVLCLPGLTRNGRDFDAVAARLAPRRRVIRPDMRGRGLSDPGLAESYTVAVEATDILALVDALGLTGVVVLGTSRGGLQAMALAAMRPGLLSGAVLNDVGPVFSLDGLRRIVAGMRAASLAQPDWPAAEAATRAAHDAALPDLQAAQWRAFTQGLYLARNGAPTLAYDPALTDATAAAVSALEAARSDGAAPDFWPLFDALSQRPVAVLRGARSDVLTDETLAAMVRGRPMVTAHVIANRGHAPLLDEPACVTAIDALLERADASEGC